VVLYSPFGKEGKGELQSLSISLQERERSNLSYSTASYFPFSFFSFCCLAFLTFFLPLLPIIVPPSKIKSQTHLIFLLKLVAEMRVGIFSPPSSQDRGNRE
jgi:hypothetical protein